MGKNSRSRRDARRRAHPRATRITVPPDVADDQRGARLAEIVGLIDTAVLLAVSAPRAAGARIAQLNELSAATEEPALDPAQLVVEEVLSSIGTAWENGWQPADLVHVVRRRTSAPAARWLGRAVLVESDRSGAVDRAPRAWSDQLAELASRHGDVGGSARLLPPGGLASTADWLSALVVLDLVHRLPRSQLLGPPPSQWGRARPAGPAPARTPQRAKVLTRIRALLAKAESTDFPAEAEAFTAKAQDLMTRHAIDEALLADEAHGSVDVGGVRVLIHHPYAMEKAGLLDVISRANRTRAVWSDYASSMTIVGSPTDLAQVEMLFTSTLVQATRAMTRAGELAGSRGSDRSSGFRKAFLSAYAVRIGQRLVATSEAAAATFGTDLVPVFERQAEAIDGEVERLFPHVTTGSRRTTFDARGWDAGTRAADAAVLPAGIVES